MSDALTDVTDPGLQPRGKQFHAFLQDSTQSHISSSDCISTGLLSCSKERMSEPIATTGSQEKENVLWTLSESPEQTGGSVCQSSHSQQGQDLHRRWVLESQAVAVGECVGEIFPTGASTNSHGSEGQGACFQEGIRLKSSRGSWLLKAPPTCPKLTPGVPYSYACGCKPHSSWGYFFLAYFLLWFKMPPNVSICLCLLSSYLFERGVCWINLQ